MKTLFTILTILLLCSVFMGGVVESKGVTPVYWLGVDSLLLPTVVYQLSYIDDNGDTIRTWPSSMVAANDDYVLKWDSAGGFWYMAADVGAGGGENNTASSSGAGFKLTLPKAGSNLPFKTLTGGTGITIDSATANQVNFIVTLGSLDSTHVSDSGLSMDDINWEGGIGSPRVIYPPPAWVGGNMMNDVKVDLWGNSYIDTANIFESGTADSIMPVGTKLQLVYYDSVALGWDSAEVVHPMYKYFPQKLLGYQHWIVATPYYAGGNHEDPWIWVGNDIDNMHLFIDSIPGSPTFGDSLAEELDDVANGYNSDPGIFYDEGTGYLWCYWRNYRPGTYSIAAGSLWVAMSDPDTIIIWGRSTTNGLDWTSAVKLLDLQSSWFIYDDDGDASPAYDSSDGGSYTRQDTLRAKGLSCESPSIIRYDGKYYLYGRTDNDIITRAGTNNDFAYDSLYRWSADSIAASTFDSAGFCTITKTSHNAGNNPTWHPQVVVGPDSLLWCVNGELGTGALNYNLSLHTSSDSGQTFTVVTEMLIDTGAVNTFDRNYIYTGSAAFLDRYYFAEKGLYTKLRIVYSADSLSTTYGVGYTDAWFEVSALPQWTADNIADSAIVARHIKHRQVLLDALNQGSASVGQIIEWVSGGPWTADFIDSTNVSDSGLSLDDINWEGGLDDSRVLNNITIDEAGDLSDTLGTIFRTFVDRQDTTLAGHPIDTITDALADGDVLTWKDATSTWEPEAGGGGETNTLGDTGVFNNTSGFGLAGGKTGTVLKVKGLIEGSNITITKSADSALIITGSAGGSGSTDTVGFSFGDTTKYQVDKAIKIKKGFGLDNTPFADSSGMDTTTLSVDTANDITSLERFAKVTDDTTNFKAAHGWGDHSTYGYEVYSDSGTFTEYPKGVINTQLYIGNASDTATADSMAATHGYVGSHTLDTTGVLDIMRDSISGDATVGAGGALTIGAGVIESTMVGADQINDLDINFGTGTDQVSTDDVTEGTNKYDQALPDSSGWGRAVDSVDANNYMHDEADTTFEGIYVWDTGNDASGAPLILRKTRGSVSGVTAPADEIGLITFWANNAGGFYKTAAIQSTVVDTNTEKGFLNFYKYAANSGSIAARQDTAGNWIFIYGAYKNSGGLKITDSAYITLQHVKVLIEDSLNEYSLTTDIASTYMRNNGDTVTGTHVFNAAYKTTSAVSDSQYITKAYADSNVIDNIQWVGDINLTGRLNEADIQRVFDVSNAYGANPDNRLEIVVPDEYIAAAADSYLVTHVSHRYYENGYLGYKYWWLVTPLKQTSHENPCLYCSNDSLTPHTYIDSFNTGSLDTLDNPVIDYNDVAAGHLSDVHLCDSDDGNLIICFRATYAAPTPDSQVIFFLVSDGQDGAGAGDAIGWGDTLRGYTDSGNDAAISWSVDLTGGGIYRAWSVNWVQDDSSFIEVLEADSLWQSDGTDMFSIVDTSNLEGQTTGNDVRHLTVKRVFGNTYAAISMEGTNATASAAKIVMSTSHDGGFTFGGYSSSVFPAAASNKWNGTKQYRSDGHWRWDGESWDMPFYLAGYNTDTGWGMGYTVVHLKDSTTYFQKSAVTSTGGTSGTATAPSMGLLRDSTVNTYQDVFLPFATIFGREDTTAGVIRPDSVTLLFPQWMSGKDTSWAWTDSSFDVGSTITDTVPMELTIPYDFYCDSLVYWYRTTGSISRTQVYISRDTSTFPIPDSSIINDGTARTSTTLARIPINVSDTLWAGTVVKLKIHTVLTLNQNDVTKFMGARLKGNWAWHKYGI